MGTEQLDLLIDFTKREISARYRSSYLGAAWTLLNPILMWSVYALVFAVILRVHAYTGSAQSQPQYLLNLFLGLSVFFFFSEVVTAAPDAIARRPNFVKRIVFPLWILVASRVLAAGFSLIINIALVVLAAGVTQGGIPLSTMLVSVVLLPIALFSFGLALALASVGVFVPDLSQIVRPLARLLFYLAPIIYPITLIPETYRSLLWVNPLTSMTEHLRVILIEGGGLPWLSFGSFVVVSFLVSGAGWVIFNRLRPGFADVL